MRPVKIFLPLLCCLAAMMPLVGKAQKIVYSDPEKEDYRQIKYEIVGRMSNNNVIIYKNYRTLHSLSVYDAEMQLKEKNSLDFIPDRVLNVDFINYPDFFYMVYQYQRKNVVYCMGIKMGLDGKPLSDPVELDTTNVSSTGGDNKIYSSIVSNDRNKILVFKINKKNEGLYHFTTVLFDRQLVSLRKSRLTLPMRGRDASILVDFQLDNEGDLIFGRCIRAGGREFVTDLDIILKRPEADTFQIIKATLEEKYLDDVKINIDNQNRRLLVNSFFYKKGKGNLEGLYTSIWTTKDDPKVSERFFYFNDTLRLDAKSENSTYKSAFNDYYIRNVIPRRDGGYVVMSELFYSSVRGQSMSRWDYLNRPYMYPNDYYYWNPYGYSGNPYNRYGGQQSTRYYYEKIVVLSFNQVGQLEWTNIISKNQYDDDDDNMLSYSLFNAGGELFVLYNQQEKKELLLNAQSINPKGEIKRSPTARNLDKGYNFMPRYGKQTGARQLVIPCLYRNYISFAKIDF